MSVLLYRGDKRVLMWLWACDGDKQRHFYRSTDVQFLLLLDGPNYTVYKGCVLHDWGKLEPNAIKWDVLAEGRYPAASLTIQTKHCLRYQAGPQCILGNAGPWRIHLEQPLNSGNKGCIRLTFEGVFKLGRPCCVECGLMKDAASESGCRSCSTAKMWQSDKVRGSEDPPSSFKSDVRKHFSLSRNEKGKHYADTAGLELKHSKFNCCQIKTKEDKVEFVTRGNCRFFCWF